MPRLHPPEPDEPQPPGVTPNQPKDPSVYGGQWGDSGQPKPAETPPPDRPEPITPPPDASDVAQPTPSAPPTTTP